MGHGKDQLYWIGSRCIAVATSFPNDQVCSQKKTKKIFLCFFRSFIEQFSLGRRVAAFIFNVYSVQVGIAIAGGTPWISSAIPFPWQIWLGLLLCNDCMQCVWILSGVSVSE